MFISIRIESPIARLAKLNTIRTKWYIYRSIYKYKVGVLKAMKS